MLEHRQAAVQAPQRPATHRCPSLVRVQVPTVQASAPDAEPPAMRWHWRWRVSRQRPHHAINRCQGPWRQKIFRGPHKRTHLAVLLVQASPSLAPQALAAGHAHLAALLVQAAPRWAACRAASAATAGSTACSRSAALTASQPPDACRGLVAAAHARAKDCWWRRLFRVSFSAPLVPNVEVPALQ